MTFMRMKNMLMILVGSVYSVPVAISAINLFIPSALESVLPLLGPALCIAFVYGMLFMNLLFGILSVFTKQPLYPDDILLAKLCLIPFYITSVVSFTLLPMLLGPWGIPLYFITPFVLLFTWQIMICSSVHSVAWLILMRRQKRISIPQLLAHTLLQFIPGLDIFDSFYWYGKHLQWKTTS